MYDHRHIYNIILMNIHDLFASSIGTGLAEIITLPICTIKTNYQTNLNYNSLNHVIKDIYQTRGVIGFYNASYSAILSQIVATSTKFTFYNSVKNYRNTQQNDLLNNMLNGSISGGVASIFSHPFDVIKIQHQLNNNFTNELKKNGSKLFYRGYSKSLSKNIVLSSLLFPFYDFYKSHVNNSLISACLTSLTVTIITHPIDFLKVRNIADKQLYFSYNILKYYRGVHINLLRVIPHFMITMLITEKIKHHFNTKN